MVAKSAFLQTATAAHISGPIYEAFFCSGSLKPGSFGYLWHTALALTGPIKDTLVEYTILAGTDQVEKILPQNFLAFHGLRNQDWSMQIFQIFQLIKIFD